MWRMALPPTLATVGDTIERVVAPPLYRRSPVITLSPSSRDELVGRMGLRPDRVTVVPPGVDDRFRPGSSRSDTPLVLGVGRLVPVKRFDLLLEAVAAVRRRRADVRLVIVGDGHEREALEERIRALDADDWVELRGRVDDQALVELYRRAWVVASTSLREGWGMTITEAAACGTPAVATRIPGHVDALTDGVTGLLADPGDDFADALLAVIDDPDRRVALGAAALERAERLRWDATAEAIFSVLADDAARRRR
jgi:glycosyltransferase involved in cell wall biosynthesis